jgi:hypothetical protein
VPAPYHSLLVHNNDMTPTLENFHDSRIHLEILQSEQRGNFYFRTVVLRWITMKNPWSLAPTKCFWARFRKVPRR